MSRQLARIRSLISEIDEIQKQGQAKARTYSLSAGPEAELAAVKAAHEIAPVPPISPPVQEPGRIALSLSHNVILEIQCGETVEIKKAKQGLEIVFQDGKAFHIPFKDVA